MARGFWIKRTANSVFDDVRNFYVKTAIGAWSQVTDAWVKTSTGQWQSFWSALMSPDSRVELVAFPEYTSLNTLKLLKFRGRNYHWTPTPQSLRYYFKEIYNDTSTQFIGPGGAGGAVATNPSTGSSILYPSSSTFITIDPAGNQYTSGGTSRYYFEVRATGASGSVYSSVSTDVVEITTPRAPSISVTYLSGTSVRLTISGYSYDDYVVTGRYIVYTYDNVAGYVYSGGGRGGYAADNESKQVTITGLAAGREYTFYVLPTTGDTGTTPFNYNGYPGIEGSQTSVNNTPLLQNTPQITGNSYPTGTVTVSNGTWEPTPTSYLYQWQRSIDTTDSNYSNIPGETSNSYSIPSNFISSGYRWLRCYVTAIRGSSTSQPALSFPIEVISQQLATPTLSASTPGYTTYPLSFASVTVNNYYTAYTGNETWTASISPSSGVTVSQNQEFPEEWLFSNLSPGVSYTVTISVNRTGFVGASANVLFTSLRRRALNPTFSIFFGTESSNGYIAVESIDAASIGWSVYRTANGTGRSGFGNLNTYGLFDGGTRSSSSGIYYLPRNGYYYMVATGFNSDGSSSNTVYSNGSGQSGTQQNWFYTGPADPPSAGFSYADGTNAVLNWSPYVNFGNNNMGASYLNNVTSYEVFWNGTGSTPSSSTSGDYTGITGNTFTASQGYSTTRYYWVRGVTNSGNIVGYSSWVALGSITTIANPMLATPTGVTASDTRTDGVLVSWNAVAGASYYGVWYGPVPSYDSNPDFGGPNNPNLITGTSYLDTSISAGSSRDYYVQAFRAGNPAGSKSNWSSGDSGTRTVALPLPSTPTGLSATTNRSTDVFLSWNASANASTYEIWWGGPPSDSSPPDFFPGSSTFYFDNGISQGSSRTYYVRARNSVGASPWSGGVTGTRTNPVVVVSPPSGLSINLSFSSGPSWVGSWSASGATSYSWTFYTADNSSGSNMTFKSSGSGTSMSFSGGSQVWGKVYVTATNSGGSINGESGWV
jgi:hypothetical protein